MRILLDTHILLWWLTNDRRLPSKARQLIESPRNIVAVSSASIWEIAVKRALGKIKIELPELEEAILNSGFEPLPITFRHAVEVSTLPAHHHDPFDRMLVAQCIVETARLLTHDHTLNRYGKVVMIM